MLYLSDRDIEISKRIIDGESISKLTKEYNIPKSTIRRLYNMYNYRVYIYDKAIKKEDMPLIIYTLKFDMRCFSVLNRNKYYTIDSVVELFNTDRIEEITNMRNMGIRNIKFIVDCLKNNNYGISKVVQDYIDERMI